MEKKKKNTTLTCTFAAYFSGVWLDWGCKTTGSVWTFMWLALLSGTPLTRASFNRLLGFLGVPPLVLFPVFFQLSSTSALGEEEAVLSDETEFFERRLWA